MSSDALYYMEKESEAFYDVIIESAHGEFSKRLLLRACSGLEALHFLIDMASMTDSGILNPTHAVLHKGRCRGAAKGPQDRELGVQSWTQSLSVFKSFIHSVYSGTYALRSDPIASRGPSIPIFNHLQVVRLH